MSELKLIDGHLLAAIEQLEEATKKIHDLPLQPEKDHVRSIAKAFGHIMAIRLHLFELDPSLKSEIDHDVQPDGELTAEQKNTVESLSSETLLDVDKVILSHVQHKWRKVAMVVALTMNEFDDDLWDLPDIFFSMRIKKLVEAGKLESQGDLRYMRYSEVRLQ